MSFPAATNAESSASAKSSVAGDLAVAAEVGVDPRAFHAATPVSIRQAQSSANRAAPGTRPLRISMQSRPKRNARRGINVGALQPALVSQESGTAQPTGLRTACPQAASKNDLLGQ